MLLLFGPARQAAGCRRLRIAGQSAGEVVASACERFGERFSEVVARSAIWVNGEPADGSSKVEPDDEVAVVPPVSGG